MTDEPLHDSVVFYSYKTMTMNLAWNREKASLPLSERADDIGKEKNKKKNTSFKFDMF